MAKGRRTAKSRRTMTQLRADRDVRRRESLRLRQEGFTLKECAETLGCSIPTVSADLRASGVDSGDTYQRRATKLLGLPDAPVPAPSENGAHSPVEPDWDGLLHEAISALRRKADSGIVGAATALAKLAVQESRTGSCDRHVPVSDVNTMVREICTTYNDEFRGSFVRALEAADVAEANTLMPLIDVSLGRVYVMLQGRLNPNDSPDGVMA